jgi:hypothetical protein
MSQVLGGREGICRQQGMAPICQTDSMVDPTIAAATEIQTGVTAVVLNSSSPFELPDLLLRF